MVGIYSSALEAVQKSTVTLQTSNISNCVNGKSRTHAGFTWRYLEDHEIPTKTITVTKNVDGAVAQLDLTGVEVNRYDMIKTAAAAVEILGPCLSKAIRNREICQMHMWKRVS